MSCIRKAGFRHSARTILWFDKDSIANEPRACSVGSRSRDFDSEAVAPGTAPAASSGTTATGKIAEASLHNHCPSLAHHRLSCSLSVDSGHSLPYSALVRF